MLLSQSFPAELKRSSWRAAAPPSNARIYTHWGRGGAAHTTTQNTTNITANTTVNATTSTASTATPKTKEVVLLTTTSVVSVTCIHHAASVAGVSQSQHAVGEGHPHLGRWPVWSCSETRWYHATPRSFRTNQFLSWLDPPHWIQLIQLCSANQRVGAGLTSQRGNTDYLPS